MYDWCTLTDFSVFAVQKTYDLINSRVETNQKQTLELKIKYHYSNGGSNYYNFREWILSKEPCTFCFLFNFKIL